MALRTTLARSARTRRSVPARTAHRLARFAAAAALLAGAGIAAAPAASADDGIGTTPGTYTYYAFPTAPDGLSSVTWTTQVTADSGPASNSFWSHQFGFNQGNGAYIGQQRNGGETSTFLFSVWDVSEAKAGSPGSYCQPFGGEGEGESCRIRLDWSAGHTYAYTVAYEGDGWFGATIRDRQTGKSVKLGSIRTPATAIKATGLIDWTEYFEWNDPRATCYDQPYSAARFGLPEGTSAADGSAAVASVTKTRSSDNACTPRTAVDTVRGGTVQRLAIGNSVRGPIVRTTGAAHGSAQSPAQCLAPKNTTSDGYAVPGTAVGFADCASGTRAFEQGWVLAADGTVRLPSDYCLRAEAGGALTAADCKAGEAADFSVSDPSEKWVYERPSGKLVNEATGLALKVSVPRG